MSKVPQTNETLGPVSTWDRVSYSALNGKQKEIYNFQQVAALLAEYGFNCIKLDDDWQGADFLAYHYRGNHTLKVQLKAGFEINKKYLDKDLYLAFRAKGVWYLIEHDALVALCAEHTGILQTASWNSKGWYYSAAPSRAMRSLLEPYALGPGEFTP